MSSQKQEDEIRQRAARVQEKMASLQADDERVRVQFLKTELDACSMALQIAETELRSGTAAGAEREARIAQQGAQVIRKFVTQVRGEVRSEIERQATELERQIEQVRQKIREKAKWRRKA